MSLYRACYLYRASRPRRSVAVIKGLLHTRPCRQQASAPQSSASGITFDPYASTNSNDLHSNSHPNPSSPSTDSSSSALNSWSSSSTINSRTFSSSSYNSSTSATSNSQAPPSSDDGTEQLRLSILEAALKQVPAHGWTEQSLQVAVRGTSYSPSILSTLQPEPVWCLVAHFLTQSTHAAFALYQALPLDRLNKQQRTAHLLALLLQVHAPYLSHMSSLLGLCFAPSLARHSLPLLAELTDECMYVLQDSSSSTDWYSRRIAFASIWTGALLHRSVDRSEGGRDSQQWVGRRVDEWVRGEEALGEMGVMADLYGGMGYNALLNVLAGKK